MPNPNAIVGLISRIDPPVEKSGAEMFRVSPDGFSIQITGERGDEQSVRLYPSERAPGLLEILEKLRQMRSPVYLEIDPANRGIVLLLIPLVSQILDMRESSSGDVEVSLSMSHARLVLRRDSPDFNQLQETLKAAIGEKSWQIVTETDSHEIIDVRRYTGELPRGTGGEPGPPTQLRRRGFWHWFYCLFRCVSVKRAKRMFDMCAATTCHPIAIPPPCIPFLYPDDGCWARAHEMCRLMIAEGVHCEKVWIDGWLHTLTRNNPNCFVDWGWHVAPTICVRKWFFCHSEQVIDPSLFTGPVSKATWKGVQGDPAATLTDSPASLYMRPAQTDVTYALTNDRLNFYRLRLLNRSLLPGGPPPYAHCP